MSMAIIGAGVSIGTAGYQVYRSVKKDAEAKKYAAQNMRPVFKPDGSIKEVYNMAASNLDNTDLQDYYSSTLDKGLSRGIDAVLKSGGKADFETLNNAHGNQLTAAYESLIKDKNLKTAAFNNAAYNDAKSRDAAFQYNEDAEWKDQKQYEADLRQQAEQSRADAISTGIAAFSNYATATTDPGEYGARTERQEQRRLSRENARFPNAPRVENANPELINVRTAPPVVSRSMAGTIVGFDDWGNPIYG